MPSGDRSTWRRRRAAAGPPRAAAQPAAAEQPAAREPPAGAGARRRSGRTPRRPTGGPRRRQPGRALRIARRQIRDPGRRASAPPVLPGRGSRSTARSPCARRSRSRRFANGRTDGAVVQPRPLGRRDGLGERVEERVLVLLDGARSGPTRRGSARGRSGREPVAAGCTAGGRRGPCSESPRPGRRSTRRSSRRRARVPTAARTRRAARRAPATSGRSPSRRSPGTPLEPLADAGELDRRRRPSGAASSTTNTPGPAAATRPAPDHRPVGEQPDRAEEGRPRSTASDGHRQRPPRRGP